MLSVFHQFNGSIEKLNIRLKKISLEKMEDIIGKKRVWFSSKCSLSNEGIAYYTITILRERWALSSDFTVSLIVSTLGR